MQPGRCGPLAAWISACIDGQVGLEEVTAAVTGEHQVHVVDGAAGLFDALVALRRDGGPVRVVYPVAGDVRGLPGPAAFRAAALAAGEAVVGASLGLLPGGVVGDVVHWRLVPVDPAPADPLTVSEAQYELTEAIRETAGALAAAEVAGRGSVDGLRDARRAGEAPNLPRGFPARGVATVSQAERLNAVLDLALLDPVGGAVDRTGIAARTDALRPLVTAVRRARAAGYNVLTETC